MSATDAYAYDYLIIGGGGAGLSLAYHMAQEPRLAGKRVVLVEPEAVKANDRTWRYWATCPPPFEAIEAHRWDQLVLRTPTYEQVFGLGTYRYRMVRAQDFYAHVHRVLATRPLQFTCLTGHVTALQEVPGGVCVHLAHGQSLRVRYAFDSRLPVFVQQPTRYRYLEQHFRGWEIETDHDAFDPATVQFMDFQVPQHGQARFVYALPFSKRRALVEFTVFSPQRLPTAEYETELRRYLAAHLGGRPYRIVAEEGGSIPMTDHPLPAQASAHVLNLGTRAGRAKPSTGYTFARIQRHSARLVQALAATGRPGGPSGRKPAAGSYPEGQPAPTAPNQVWVGDITYLPLLGGCWCYLATWRDACSQGVVGWHLAAQMPTELVLHALEQALTLRQPAPGLIIHADCGSQYTSAACRARIDRAKAVPNFSRPGNPYDNAQAEAGWSTLKTELLPPRYRLCLARRSPPGNGSLPRHLLQSGPAPLRPRLPLTASI